MASILLLHSALGLRPGVLGLADELAALGHDVVAPDYYRGRVFDDEAGGIGHRDEVGGRRLFERVTRMIEDLPDDAALVGLSLGAAFAQRLAADRPRAVGVVLLHHASPPRGTWPGQPVQVHRYARDPWVDPAHVEALGRAVRDTGATFEDFVVDGTGHLFTDPGVPDHDEAATARTIAHVHRLLETASRATPGPAQ